MLQKFVIPFFIICLTGVNVTVIAQQTTLWNHKKCAVVLTYDDAIDIDLDNVVPALDSVNLKGTFYIIGASPAINNRIPEWRKAASNGHELGNHTLFHPCDGSLPGRGFVSPQHNLYTYTVQRAVDEIRANNCLLKAIDGKTRRTFAYPCGDLTIHDTAFYQQVASEFSGARGVVPALLTPHEVKLDNINSYAIINHDAAYMINLVKEAMRTHTLLVFLFHGVGGGHALNVDKTAHSQLLHFLQQNEKDIWVAPMVDVADYIQQQQSQP
ncbi:Peptidoglycan/xylan/chitin deacetylase, PgdA/CDA1 family [Filimonas lacunae]|uniref:Peptidoglycan/xylan/chitin deacetylase, PgdA/CDA1 family n=1 Tax=Filimonas lacunae TaxID=477680 RepID=A0A173MA35_9BACT|nr:polysaccharide deacetylase family protein [Filimonas lacunae]BAV04370.1 endo-1,4-beta-xylanase A precursor [Filimonas lacunae]SIT31176.1 Peptidoglycan/xylan/chitin deacetylase, PgdA/CDA1 family [Filimonas lacunae]